MSEIFRHWVDDKYWTNALDEYHQLRESGIDEISIKLSAVESSLFNEDSPAYKLMEAMCSVQEHEG